MAFKILIFCTLLIFGAAFHLPDSDIANDGLISKLKEVQNDSRTRHKRQSDFYNNRQLEGSPQNIEQYRQFSRSSQTAQPLSNGNEQFINSYPNFSPKTRNDPDVNSILFSNTENTGRENYSPQNIPNKAESERYNELRNLPNSNFDGRTGKPIREISSNGQKGGRQLFLETEPITTDYFFFSENPSLPPNNNRREFIPSGRSEFQQPQSNQPIGNVNSYPQQRLFEENIRYRAAPQDNRRSDRIQYDSNGRQIIPTPQELFNSAINIGTNFWNRTEFLERIPGYKLTTGFVKLINNITKLSTNLIPQITEELLSLPPPILIPYPYPQPYPYPGMQPYQPQNGQFYYPPQGSYPLSGYGGPQPPPSPSTQPTPPSTTQTPYTTEAPYTTPDHTTTLEPTTTAHSIPTPELPEYEPEYEPENEPENEPEPIIVPDPRPIPETASEKRPTKVVRPSQELRPPLTDPNYISVSRPASSAELPYSTTDNYYNSYSGETTEQPAEEEDYENIVDDNRIDAKAVKSILG